MSTNNAINVPSNTIALAGANANITSMTGITGTIGHPTGIVDSSGNLVVAFSSTATAVNYVTIQNQSTGNGCDIRTTGTDAICGLNLYVKNSQIVLRDSTNTQSPLLTFTNAAGTHFTALKVANAQATDLTLTLPAADGSNGYVLSTNGSGILSFQPGAIGVGAFDQVNTQTITATGAFTYTPTSGTKYAIFELQAGGGGSGGTGGAGGQGSAGNAGAGGAYIKLLVSGTANLAAITGSVGIAGTAGSSGNNAGGTGGSTTLTINSGSVWTAAGGTGGAGQAASAAAQLCNSPGTGGSPTTGTNGTLIYSASGQNGSTGYTAAAAAAIPTLPTFGGSSVLGQGGPISYNAGGTAATGYGAGAGGGLNGTGSNSAGNAGAKGVVIITEFISS